MMSGIWYYDYCDFIGFAAQNAASTPWVEQTITENNIRGVSAKKIYILNIGINGSDEYNLVAHTRDDFLHKL